MMSMYAIHVDVEMGGKHGKIGGNFAPETNDCLRMVHESWCHVKPPLC
jgi:hypothetical protein